MKNCARFCMVLSLPGNYHSRLLIMRWSKVRKRIESEFAPELQNRVCVHITREHFRSRCGRGWITIDGKEIANFCDWSYYYTYAGHKETYKDALAGYGEFRAWDFKEACWEILHDGIEPAIQSGDDLKMSLVVLHRRFGKRRLQELINRKESLHPLVRFLAQFRTDCLKPSTKNHT